MYARQRGTKYLKLWGLWDDVEVWQLFYRYLRWIWRRRVVFDFVRDLAPKFPSAVCEFAADMRRDELDSDIVVRSGHNLRPGTQSRELEMGWETK